MIIDANTLFLFVGTSFLKFFEVHMEYALIRKKKQGHV